MKRKKRIIIIAILLFGGFIWWGMRVYSVNSGIAKAYDMETYSIGTDIQLDNATCRIVDAKYDQGQDKDDSTTLTITMRIENISSNPISIIKIIETKLAFGMDYYQTHSGDFSANKLKSLPPNSPIDITLVYDIPVKYMNQDTELYIDQSLYSNRVIQAYKQGKRLGIRIGLN